MPLGKLTVCGERQACLVERCELKDWLLHEHILVFVSLVLDSSSLQWNSKQRPFQKLPIVPILINSNCTELVMRQDSKLSNIRYFSTLELAANSFKVWNIEREAKCNTKNRSVSFSILLQMLTEKGYYRKWFKSEDIALFCWYQGMPSVLYFITAVDLPQDWFHQWSRCKKYSHLEGQHMLLVHMSASTSPLKHRGYSCKMGKAVQGIKKQKQKS